MRAIQHNIGNPTIAGTKDIKMDSQTIEIKTNINVTGFLDQTLLDHLVQMAEGEFKEMYSLGEATPNDPDSLERYKETELQLAKVESKLINSGTLDVPSSNVSVAIQGVDGAHYQWLKPVVTDEGLRHINIEGDDFNFSDFLWESPEDAIEAVKSGDWGYAEKDAREWVLAEVKKVRIDNPFSCVT